MIRISGLVKMFNGVSVIEGMDLTIPTGEILAVMGPSGTGKTVLLQHLAGLLTPDAGTIEIDGQDIGALNDTELLLFRHRIGYLFQEGALFDFMTVEENVAFPLKEHTRLNPTEIQTKVNEFLELVDMAGQGDKYPSELSGGMKKRVALARAMVGDAKVLLCDEPTSGLDPMRSRDISELIRRLSKKLGCTTVLTTHDVINALRTADRAVVLNEGRIVADGDEALLRSSVNVFVKEFLRV